MKKLIRDLHRNRYILDEIVFIVVVLAIFAVGLALLSILRNSPVSVYGNGSTPEAAVHLEEQHTCPASYHWGGETGWLGEKAFIANCLPDNVALIPDTLKCHFFFCDGKYGDYTYCLDCPNINETFDGCYRYQDFNTLPVECKLVNKTIIEDRQELGVIDENSRVALGYEVETCINGTWHRNIYDKYCCNMTIINGNYTMQCQRPLDTNITTININATNANTTPQIPNNSTPDFSKCKEVPCDCWKEGCLVLCMECPDLPDSNFTTENINITWVNTNVTGNLTEIKRVIR
jgi:hypothetical protein